MKPIKKQTKSKMIGNENSLEDILRNQINLCQYYNDLNNRLHEMEIHSHNLEYQMQMMKRDNFEIKTLLTNLGSHLKNMHEHEMAERFDSGEAPASKEGSEKEVMMKKALPLHDDVMLNCEVCGCNHHVNMKACPKCGFQRAKKDGK